MDEKYFACSDSERAAFEAGIKLGAIFHQFIGVPLTPDNVGHLERAMEEAVRVQPYVQDVRVQIKKLKWASDSLYGYTTLSPEMLRVDLVVRYRKIQVEAHLDYKDDLRYPLMYITSITREE